MILRTFLVAFAVTMAVPAVADVELDVRHELVSSYETASGTHAVLNLYLRNTGTVPVHHLIIESANTYLAFDLDTASLNVGFIGVGDEAQIQWTVTSPALLEYMDSGTPFFFRATAKEQGGARVAFPVYSRGDVRL